MYCIRRICPFSDTYPLGVVDRESLFKGAHTASIHHHIQVVNRRSFPIFFPFIRPPRPQPAGVPRLSPVSHCHSNNSPATAEHAPRCGDRHPVAAGQLPSYSAILKEKYLEPPQKTGTYQSSKVTILLYADQVLGFGGSSHWYPRKWKGIIVGLGDYQVPHLELVMWCFVKPHEVESKHGLWVDVTSNFGDGKLPVPGGDPISCSLLNSRYKVI